MTRPIPQLTNLSASNGVPEWAHSQQELIINLTAAVEEFLAWYGRSR